MIYTPRISEPLKFQTKIVIHRWIPTEVRNTNILKDLHVYGEVGDCWMQVKMILENIVMGSTD